MCAPVPLAHGRAAGDHRPHAAPESRENHHRNVDHEEEQKKSGDKEMKCARGLPPAKRVDGERELRNQRPETSPAPSRSPGETGRRSPSDRRSAARRCTSEPPLHPAARGEDTSRSLPGTHATSYRPAPGIGLSGSGRSTDSQIT